MLPMQFQIPLSVHWPLEEPMLGRFPIKRKRQQRKQYSWLMQGSKENQKVRKIIENATKHQSGQLFSRKQRRERRRCNQLSNSNTTYFTGVFLAHH